MFDDVPIKNNSQIPGNLPVGEPEDIFADTEINPPVGNPAPSRPVPEPPKPPQGLPPIQSAVGMGKIQPKNVPTPMTNDAKITNPPLGEYIFSKKNKTHTMPELVELNKIKGPSLAKNLMIFFIVIVGFSIFGGGSWLVYSLFIKDTPPEEQIVGTEDFEPVVQEEVIEEEDDALFINEPTGDEQLGDRIMEDEVLFGEPVDTDADNLSNDIELEIGLDPNNWDSDKDGLSDGDEVLVWRSNPLKSDTDGDGYDDGAEVKNGYNPIGPGRIFNSAQ